MGKTVTPRPSHSSRRSSASTAYRVDRLSRNVRQLAQIAKDLDSVGVALRSATEPFDTSSAAGKMILQMLGVVAEFERSTIVERIAEGVERAASRGRWVVGTTPFGHVRDRETKQILPDPPARGAGPAHVQMYAESRMGPRPSALTTLWWSGRRLG